MISHEEKHNHLNLTTVIGSFILVIGLLVGYYDNSQAQMSADSTFEHGLELYENGQYTEAARVFKQLHSAKSLLFAGKSYFAAGSYLNAQTFLRRIPEKASRPIVLEGKYTRALVAFQLKQFDKALTLLHSTMKGSRSGSTLRDTTKSFYTSLLSYLTVDQKREVFRAVTDTTVRMDLINAMIGRVDYPTLNTLFQHLKPYLPDSSQAPLKINRLKSVLSDSIRYNRKYARQNKFREAPDGISYNIGVALPVFNPDKAEFEVTRGLYNGIILAAEEYNKRNSDSKVFIRHRNTNWQTSYASAIFNQLAWKHPIDAIIGPLFSESASKMADLAKQYELPMLTPLANSDTLNLHNPYVFQMNPTFSVRGREMARYAVRKLGLDTMAVIAQKNALGYESAFAFRDQAERMGAKISYFFIEDFAATAYDISEHTKYFTADKQMRDSLNIQKVDAIYAPFTGRAAQTLIDLFMTDLEAADSDVTLLGSAEWGSYDMSQKRIRNFDMYYPESDPLSADTAKIQPFNRSYKNRFGLSPTKFSYIGYDAANLLLETLNKVGNPTLLKEGLRNKSLYKGLSGPIHFKGRQINQIINIKKIRLRK